MRAVGECGGNYLEAWVLSLLARPLEDLATSYAEDHTARDWLEERRAGQAENPYAYARIGVVPEETLRALHRKLRGSACEDMLWGAVVSQLAHPLPDDVADDLIDREVALTALGHSRQSDAIQWRLAPFYPEALLTISQELYRDPARSPAEFRAMLDRFAPRREYGGSEWMLRNLLLGGGASSPEKERALVETILAHPYGELHRIVELRRLEERAADETLSREEIEALYATNEPTVWRALAANPSTPTALLQALSEVRTIDHAARIRHLARSTLRSGSRPPTE